ncbi:S9 family peptidase [Sphingorhabdus sp.]|uniref:S9 family peptidase n=1 Tax=Sphingorhabdus sp. TaxID=1902408 RepID=UPI00391CFB25
MKNTVFTSALTLAVLLTATPVDVAFAQETVPLIEREKLFGNPQMAGAALSPDGKWIGWRAPLDGVMNVFVAPANNMADAKPITASKDRPIRNFSWSGDSSMVLYIQDKGGDENFLLYGVDVATGKERNYTPFDKTRVTLVGASYKDKDTLLIGLNNRNPQYHDVHLLDLKTGATTEVMRNDSYSGFIADDTLTLRMAQRSNAQGGSDYFNIVGGKVEEKPFASTGLEDSLTTAPAGFTHDGTLLYWIDSRDRNTAALYAQDMKTGKRTLVAENAKADIGGTLRDPRTGVVEAYSANYLRNEWTIVDEDLKADWKFLRTQLTGDFGLQSRTDADDIWLVWNDPLIAPSTVYQFDRKSKKLTQLYVGRPELIGAPLVPMYPVEIKSRDGLNLVSYLTLPKSADANADGKADKPVPMVLMVHGGPWARDSFGFNGYHQWLANRGYAVLSVNFRGSTGFGKDFISAGDLEWGRKMQDDLTDAVAWAVKSGVAPKDKVAIMGGSYGGYATLAGLTYTPDVYACGVDIVGPSNLETLLKTIPPYWAPIVSQFHKRMGNPNTPEGLAMLKERSPLYSADKIVRPLLIGQGANDPRVNKAESDQIVSAMQAKGIPVTYVLFPDEGHGFAKPNNNIAFNAVTESFLAKCLGGRAEPIGDTVRNSTAEVPAGAEYSPGLAAALKSN